MYVWIFENGVKELNSPLKRAFFFSPETISKGDDMKIKKKVSPYSLFSLVYLSFIAVLFCDFYIFLLLHGLKTALRSSEIKVKYG